jgi:NCS1 family nucleobase:cation symporter-1
MPDFQDEGPGSNNTSSSSQEGYIDSSKSFADSESAPLLSVAPSTEFQRTRRHTNDSLAIAFGLHSEEFGTRIRERQRVYHSSDESYFFDFIMEKAKSTKLAHFVDKLAVESEPGLTNAQLMLNNHDLKPGMSKLRLAVDNSNRPFSRA